MWIVQSWIWGTHDYSCNSDDKAIVMYRNTCTFYYDSSFILLHSALTNPVCIFPLITRHVVLYVHVSVYNVLMIQKYIQQTLSSERQKIRISIDYSNPDLGP